MRNRLIGAMAAVGALAALGAGIALGSPSSGPRSTTAPTASSNRAKAQADATALLAALNLPSSAEPSATEPAGDGAALANAAGAPATSNLVDDHAWWVIPGSPQSVISYIDAHRPAGSTPSLSGSGDRPPTTIQGFGWPAITGVLSSRQLVVEFVALPGGRTGLRADAEVTWMNPRPSAERIPAGVRRLTVSAHRFDNLILAPFTVRSPRRLRRVIAVLDSLPLSPPGAYNCPADLGLEIRMTFYGRHGAPLAASVVDPGGCEAVGLRVQEHREPALTGMDFPGSGLPADFSLTSALDKALGVKLPTGFA